MIRKNRLEVHLLIAYKRFHTAIRSDKADYDFKRNVKQLPFPTSLSTVKVPP